MSDSLEEESAKVREMERLTPPYHGRFVLRRMGKDDEGRRKVLIMGVIVGETPEMPDKPGKSAVDELWVANIRFDVLGRYRDTGKRFFGKSADQTILDAWYDETLYETVVVPLPAAPKIKRPKKKGPR
ncbi:hypothetical protein HY633_04300 [Candidatus Uhrbacteria bacterium]|nr:hypothetical protein [Candidatus Uhrbacteria bacterium]